MRGRALWVALALAAVLAVWVAHVSRPASRVEGCARGCATGGERRPGPLRVLTLNVLHGYPDFERLSERMDLIAAELRRRQPDLALLQEVPWTRRLGSGAAYLAERAGLNHVYARANGNRYAILFEEGEAILSRYPLGGARVQELAPRAGFFEHRIALHATAQTPWGAVHAVSTHLTHGADHLNLGQARSLRAFVEEVAAPGLAIVGGDLNAREDSPQVRDLARVWRDAFRSAHPRRPGLTCCIDDLLRGAPVPLRSRIDYLFVVPRSGPPVGIAGSERVLAAPFETPYGWLWASDHVGVLAEVEVGRGELGPEVAAAGY